jgi:hypothetical protein
MFSAILDALKIPQVSSGTAKIGVAAVPPKAVLRRSNFWQILRTPQLRRPAGRFLLEEEAEATLKT